MGSSSRELARKSAAACRDVRTCETIVMLEVEVIEALKQMFGDAWKEQAARILSETELASPTAD